MKTLRRIKYEATMLVVKQGHIYRVIQNKRAKIKQDIRDAPLNN